MGSNKWLLFLQAVAAAWWTMVAFGPTFSASSSDSRKYRNQRLHTLPGDVAGQGGTVAVVDDFLDAREVTD